MNDATLSKIKRCRPASLKVILVDGTEEDIAIPGKRKKWAAIAELIDKLAWVHIKCLNAKGATLDLLENDEAADEMEPLDGYGGKVHQLTALMLRSQDVALRRQEKAMKDTMDMNLQLCKLMMDRLNALEKSFGANLKLVQRFARAAGDSDGDDDLMSDQLLALMFPQLVAKLTGGKPAAGNSGGAEAAAAAAAAEG